MKMKKLFNRKGFTLLETLIAVAVVVLLAGIAIPALVNTNKALTEQQENDYAKSIFLAAQDNLTNMKTNGSLNELSSDEAAVSVYSDSGLKDEVLAMLDTEHAKELLEKDTEKQYVYAVKAADEEPGTVFEKLLTEGTIDSSILSGKKVSIIFNPISGDVFGVKYGDKGEYFGSVVSLDQTDNTITPVVTLVNGEENLIQIKVPVPDDYLSEVKAFLNDITFTIKVSDSSNADNSFTYVLNSASSGFTMNEVTRTASWALDSLVSGRSFADRNKNAKIKTGEAIAAGSNVTVSVEKYQFSDSSDYSDLEFDYDRSTVSGNSLFASYKSNTITVSNGRNLQNLNNIDKTLASTLASNGVKVVLGKDIRWGDTLSYYHSSERFDKDTEFLCPDGSKTTRDTFRSFIPLKATITETLEDKTIKTYDSIFADGSKVTVDGCGYSIRNLYVFNVDGDGEAGLFENLLVSVSNLTFIDPIIKGSGNAGALAAACGYKDEDKEGPLQNKIEIKNCRVVLESDLTIDSDILDGKEAIGKNTSNIYGACSINNNSVGLLIGCGYNITIEGSSDISTVDMGYDTATGTAGRVIPASGYHFGLVIGYAENCTIKNVISKGSIKGGKAATVGGIAGCTSGENAKMSVTDSCAYGSISNIKMFYTGTADEYSMVGGAVGLVNAGTFSTSGASVILENIASDTEYNDIVACPSGLGTVGKFTGYIVGGSFTGCYGKGSADQAYQFLGAVSYVSSSDDSYLYDDEKEHYYYYSDKLLNAVGFDATRNDDGVTFQSDNVTLTRSKHITLISYPSITMSESGGNTYIDKDGSLKYQYITKDSLHYYNRTSYDDKYQLSRASELTDGMKFIISGNGRILTGNKKTIKAEDINNLYPTSLYRGKWPTGVTSYFKYMTSSYWYGFKYGLWDTDDKDAFSYYYSTVSNDGNADKPFVPNSDDDGDNKRIANDGADIYRYTVSADVVSVSEASYSETDFNNNYSKHLWQWVAYDEDDNEGLLKFIGDSPAAYVYLSPNNIADGAQKKLHLLPDGDDWQDQDSPTILNMEFKKIDNQYKALIYRYQRLLPFRQASFLMDGDSPSLEWRTMFESDFGSEYYVDIYQVKEPDFNAKFDYLRSFDSYSIVSE